MHPDVDPNQLKMAFDGRLGAGGGVPYGRLMRTPLMEETSQNGDGWKLIEWSL